MKHTITILLIFCCVTGNSQNLVSNPGFEQHFECPVINVFYGVTNWYAVVRHSGTPDYYNVCGDPFNGASVPTNWLGYQVPYEGDAYIGMFSYNKAGGDVREYVQTRLISPLIAGKWYRISFWASLSDESNYATNKLGIYLSTDSVFGNNSLAHLNLTPNISAAPLIPDQANWTLITGDYKASGGEQFLTLGNFYPDEDVLNKKLHDATLEFAYYFVDNVSVAAINTMDCSAFAVYPNPASNRINIRLPCQTIEVTTIYSASGQLVKQSTGQLQTIDVQNLSAGLYLLVITTTDNKRLVKKFIKTTP